MSHAAISRRLNGHAPFDVDELVQIAEVFEVDPRDLLARSSPWITAEAAERLAELGLDPTLLGVLEAPAPQAVAA